METFEVYEGMFWAMYSGYKQNADLKDKGLKKGDNFKVIPRPSGVESLKKQGIPLDPIECVVISVGEFNVPYIKKV